MAFPPDIPTVTLTVGSAFSLEDGDDLSIVVRLDAVRPDCGELGDLIWAPTGDRYAAIGTEKTGPAGQPVEVSVPATNIEGWKTVGGDPIDVNGGELHTHAYVVTIYLAKDGKRLTERVIYKPVFLPEGITPVDLDTLAVVPQASGVPITLPEQWTKLVQAARDAADRAEQYAALAWGAVNDSGYRPHTHVAQDIVDLPETVVDITVAPIDPTLLFENRLA